MIRERRLEGRDDRRDQALDGRRGLERLSLGAGRRPQAQGELSATRRNRHLARGQEHHGHRDRKSTRLNSSHQIISYAVFCLKKKKTTKYMRRTIVPAL